MAGKQCTGAATNNAALPHQSRAFCEGLEYRSGGTLVQRPATGNPHDGTGSEAETAWDAGWAAAEAVKGVSAVAHADAPCCAIPHGTVPA